MMISSGAAALAARQRRIMACRSLNFLVQSSSSSLSSLTCPRCRTSGSSISISSISSSSVSASHSSSSSNDSRKQLHSTMIVPLAIRRRNQTTMILPPLSPLSHAPQIHGLMQQKQQQQQRSKSATTTTALPSGNHHNNNVSSRNVTKTAEAASISISSSTVSFRAANMSTVIPADTSSMNAILEDWCNACKTKAAAATAVHPTEMLAWVDKQQQQQQKHQHVAAAAAAAAVANTRTYTLLMDGALAFFANNKTRSRHHHRRGSNSNHVDEKKKKTKKDNAYTFVSSLLELMLQESNSNNSNNSNIVAPKVMHFHKVMTAAIKHDDNNIIAAEEWLVRLLNLYRAKLVLLQEQGEQDDDQQQHQHDVLAPTVDSFAIVIAAWSRIGFPIRAEYVLHQLMACHAEFASTGLDLHPRREHYESCINAWIQASYFARRKQQQARHRRGGNPTNNTAAAASMAKIAGHRTEALVLQMMELHQQQQYDVKPNIHSLFKVLTCWVQSQTPPPPSLRNENNNNNNKLSNVMAAERATAILKLMLEMQQEEQEQDNKQGGKSDSRISDSSSCSNEDKRQRHKQEQDRIIANAYVRVIQAWSSCCCYSSSTNKPSLLLSRATVTAATATAPIEMVEMLLHQLQDYMETMTTDHEAVPAKAWQKACTHAIAAWGRVIATTGGANDGDDHFKNVAVERAQAIFDGFFSKQMAKQQEQKQHDDEDHDDDDDNKNDDDCLVNMYNELLHVYRRVGDSARADALLRRMQQHQRDCHEKNGNNNRSSKKMPKPNAKSFNWAK